MDHDVSVQAGGASVTAGHGADDSAASRSADPAAAVTALYAEHALRLTRLALIMVGDRQTAEDIVQDAFCGLHRCWRRLRDPDKALPYVRISRGTAKSTVARGLAALRQLLGEQS